MQEGNMQPKESQATGATWPKSYSGLPLDYVIVFSLVSIDGTKDREKAVTAAELKSEYAMLLERLAEAGLSATGRPGAKGTNELLILVTAHDEKPIRREIEAERLADWLHGITSIKPEAQLSRPYTKAERLRHLYNIITRDHKPSSDEPSASAHPLRPLAGQGAGVIPGQAPFKHVKSIFPPHDLTFNKTWLTSWSDRSHLSIRIPAVELDQIKDTYGDSIGYYFAFLDFYFQALILPTALGFVFWLFGLYFSSIYSIALLVWSIIFLETWNVKERLLAIKWNSFRCHKVEKRRVQFKPERMVTHLVTRELVGHFPWWKREIRKLFTIPMLFFFAVGIATLITAITAVEVMVAEVYSGPFKKAMGLLPTALFSAFVPQLVRLWQATAVKLTAWENHSYESAYDRSLTIKMFTVQGLVAYAGLLLTAFVYVPFGSLLVPHLAGVLQNLVKDGLIPVKFSASTQTLDLSTYSINGARLYEQLFAYTVTNQVVNSFTEVGLPQILKVVTFKWHKILDDRQQKHQASCDKAVSRMHSHVLTDEADERELLERLREEARRPEYHLFVEYAEMVTQFGYVVLWTVIWPISPLFAFVNNFFELRTDAIKLTKQSRRPVPTRCDSIGPWLDVLKMLTWLGTVINAALVYLFKSSGEFTAATIGESATNSTQITSKEGLIKANLLTAAVRDQTEDSARTKLSLILLSALVPVVFSEHAFFIIRLMIRELVTRLMWKDSEADIKQRTSDWELKQSFIDKLHHDDDDSAQPRRFFDLVTGSGKPPREEFWERRDGGLELIESLGKTE